MLSFLSFDLIITVLTPMSPQVFYNVAMLAVGAVSQANIH